MKKYISIALVAILILCGCAGYKESIKKNDYTINNNDTIKIGVVLPLSEDSSEIGNEILDGISFANELAPAVNIDKRYNLSVTTYDINSDMEDIKDRMISDNVAAVICYGTDNERTINLIQAFESESTPLMFIDNNSNEIKESATAISLSVPADYQVSAISSFVQSEGFSTGVVICEDNEYYKYFADNFKAICSANVDIYTSAPDIHTFDINDITSNCDFALIAGNNTYSQSIAKKLKEISSDFPIILTEMHSQAMLNNNIYDGCYFLSKFESDSDNHYVTDFINIYTQMKDVTSSDITSAVAYGYDAYMLLYGALAQFNPGTSSLTTNSISDNSDTKSDSLTITASQVAEALTSKDRVYGGPIDTFTFDSNGILKPTYIFLDSVKGGAVSMYNKFTY